MSIYSLRGARCVQKLCSVERNYNSYKTACGGELAPVFVEDSLCELSENQRKHACELDFCRDGWYYHKTIILFIQYLNKVARRVDWLGRRETLCMFQFSQ